jgi:hypothetical protein
VSWSSISNAKFIIGSTTQFPKIKRDLKSIVKNLDVQPSNERALQYLDLTTYKVISTFNGNCIPVLEKIVTPNTVVATNYRIEVNDNIEICLVSDSVNKKVSMGQVTTENRFVTLMKVKPRGDTIIKSPDDSEKVSIETLDGISMSTFCWMNSKPYSLVPALQYLERAPNEDKDWMQNSLRLRLEQLNIRPISYIVQNPISDDDVASNASDDLGGFDEDGDGFVDFGYTEDMLDDIDVYNEMFRGEDEDFDGLYSLIEEDQMLLEEFADSRRKADLQQPERKNKFWDNYISKLRDTTGVKLISEIMSNSGAYIEIEVESLNRYSKAFYAIMRGRIVE